MERESFVFYSSFYDAIELLPAEQKLQAYEAICKYGIRGEKPKEENGVVAAMFSLIQPQLDKDRKIEEK